MKVYSFDVGKMYDIIFCVSSLITIQLITIKYNITYLNYARSCRQAVPRFM